MNRRDFLRPRRLAQAAVPLLDAVDALEQAAEDSASESQESALLRYSRQAMATTFEILIPFGTPQALTAADNALNEIDRLEAQLSVYQDDSEVSLLNHGNTGNPQVVEAGLHQLLRFAKTLHEDTSGAFDIAVGALTKAWGFYRRDGRIPSESERREVLQRCGMGHIHLDEEAQTVTYRRSGLEINLGSIGKGYALDRAAEVLRREFNVTRAVLHGGKSSVLALGSPPGREDAWTIGIRHPWNPEQRLAVVRLRDKALGTSAATFQHLEYNGRKLGHILDPRTGWPAKGMASASAIAPTATEADALATAFFIMGVEKTKEYCEAHPGVGALLLPADGNAEAVVINIRAEEILICPGSERRNASE